MSPVYTQAKLAELRDLLSKGLLDEETFRRAVAKAQEELDRLANAKVSVGFNLEGFTAAFDRIAGAAATRDNSLEQNTATMARLQERQLGETGRLIDVVDQRLSRLTDVVLDTPSPTGRFAK